MLNSISSVRLGAAGLLAALCLIILPSAAQATTLPETRYLLSTLRLGLGAIAMFTAAIGLGLWTAGRAPEQRAESTALLPAAAIATAALAYLTLGAGMLSSPTGGGVLAIPGPVFLDDGLALAGRFLELEERALLGASGAQVAVETALACIAGVIAAGAAAARARPWAGAVAGGLTAGIVTPLHRVWTSEAGWLGQAGFYDPAGVGSALLVPGILAFVGAALLGDRDHPLWRPEVAKPTPAGRPALAIVGAGFALPAFIFGGAALAGSWSDVEGAVRFGSALVGLFATAASGAVAAGLLGTLGAGDRLRAFDGAVAGLVAGLAAAGTPPAGMVLLGVAAGTIATLLPGVIRYTGVDDAVRSLSVIAAPALLGLMIVGFTLDDVTIAAQILGSGASILIAAASALPVWLILRAADRAWQAATPGANS